MNIGEIIWDPDEDFLKNSNISRFMRKHNIKSYSELIKRSTEDIEWFWDAALKDTGVEWFRPYSKIMDMSDGFPWTKWFIGGQINIVHNCLDRHALKPNSAGKVALIWEGEDGQFRSWTYGELYREVNRCANALKSLGISRGAAVGFYMPMIPELIIAFFACLKLGAVVVPIFSGFGSKALATRLQDAEALVLISADGSLRRGKAIGLKEVVDEVAASVPTLRHTIIVKRTAQTIPWVEGRDIWWRDIVPIQSDICQTEALEAEDRSLIIFTSGTTGRPKGTVHTHAGCIAQMAKEIGYYFDYRPGDVFFWVTDIGWMMGPWQIIGVQFYGGTHVIYEGAPNHPNPGRLWEMVDRHRVTTLGISPTLIRMLMREGVSWVGNRNLRSLRVLGSTGEPWDRDSYIWYFENVGRRRCPIINISGGTEIVGCLLAPLPIAPLKPCTLLGPGLGMDVDVFDDDGKPIRGGIGHLVCKKPAPSMTKGFLKDPQRYIETYFSRWPDVWYHGDWAHIDNDGFWFLHGRADDTIKVGGKRVGPAEIEAALMEDQAVSEACAIGIPHEIKGEAIVCFVVLHPNNNPGKELASRLKDEVAKILGKTLTPDEIKFVGALPKTRSAKIVRGVIRKKYLGEELGDLSSVENPEALDAIR